MNRTILIFPSITPAMRAQRMFAQNGIRAIVRRRVGQPDGKGCSFMLLVHAGQEQVAALMAQHSIPYADLQSGGAWV